MRLKSAAAAVLVATFGSGTAHAIEVHRSVTVSGSPNWVWLDVGSDFCEIEDWLPVLSDCKDWDEDGVTYRDLTTTDGGVVKEQLTAETDTSYSYDILSSPLPVANYHATFSVSPGGDGTVIDWHASFDAAGVSNAEAASVIAGIFEAGLNKIVEDRN